MTGDMRTQLTPRFSLRVKGMLVLLFPVLALLGVVNSILWLEQGTRRADELLQLSLDLRFEMETIRVRMLEAEAALNEYAESGEPEVLASYRRIEAELTGSLDRLASLTAVEDGPSRQAQQVNRAAREQMETLRALAASHDTAVTRDLIPRLRKGRYELFRQLDAAVNAAGKAYREAGESRRVSYRRFAFVALLCGIVGPFGGLFLNLFLTNRVTRRVRQLGANAHRLATGQALEPMPPGSDEISTVARELEEAAVLLRAREARLTSSEKRYRDLFDQAPVPYHEAGRDGIIHRVNQDACRLIGQDVGQIVGRPFWSFIALEHREETREALLEAIEKGVDPAPIEVDHEDASGTRITVVLHVNLVRGEHGEVSGFRAALLDVTEHRLAVMAARKVEQYAQELRNKNEQMARAAAAARAATEAKSRFLANMSHELRTPLNSIIGFSELMYDGKVGQVDDAHRDFLADILTSARHLLQLINDILDLSKIESGKLEFRPERCDPARLAEEVCDVLRPLISKKALKLHLELERGLSAFIDPARTRQVLYNYLSNAVKFTQPGGTVTVRLAGLEGARFRMEVEDTGMGIAAEDLSRLFLEFEQLAASKKEGQGSGLGLALTKRLVEAQGGRVGVRSEPGKGSTFFAELPLGGEGRPAELPVRSHRPRSVLVIEDSLQDSRWLCQILREAGYAVEAARNRAEADAQLSGRTFDAITLDLMLPDASGWEVLQGIRATGPNRATPVVVISIAAQHEMGPMFPVQGYLPKPVRSEDLLHVLETAGVPPRRNRTVLVVDDDAATQRLVQATLAGLGYRAVCRHDGESGLTALAQERPAVVLLDLMMPVMDGLKFLQRLRDDTSLPRPPVIVWTNKDLSSAEKDELAGLAEAVMAKQDCTPKALLDQLRAIVG